MDPETAGERMALWSGKISLGWHFGFPRYDPDTVRPYAIIYFLFSTRIVFSQSDAKIAQKRMEIWSGGLTQTLWSDKPVVDLGSKVAKCLVPPSAPRLGRDSTFRHF